MKRANVTTITNKFGTTIVTYYSTAILTYDVQNKTVSLNNGGFATASTKRHINEALSELGLPYKVSQKGFVWYCTNTRTNENTEFVGNKHLIHL